MNPAINNYLESQQQPNRTPDMEQAQVPQQAYNPFDAGINKAISSARESLGMTDKQQDKALRRSMAAFGNNIAQQPKQKGFWNNLGSVGRSLSPALQEYDNSEDAALTQNNAIANQILAHQAAEDRRLGQAEEKAWNRQRAEDQSAQQGKMNDARLDIYGLQANKLRRELEQRELEPRELEQRELDSSSPQAYDDKTLAYIRKKNVDHSEDVHKSNNVSKITIQALGDIRDVLQVERDNNSWQQGSSTTAQLSRFMAKTTGMNDAQKTIELKRMPLFDSLKQKFGARITNMDLELFMKALPGLDQPADVAINELDQRINDEKAALQERSIRQGIVETEFNNSVPFYSDLVSQRVDDELANLQRVDDELANLQGQDTQIRMLSPEGVEFNVPADKVDIFKENRYRMLE